MRLLKQFLKFGVVGLIAFIIDYGLLVALTEICGINYLISATISFTVSVLFNYFASMRYVFTHKEGMSRARECAIFIILSVIGLGINDALMYLGTDLLGVSYLLTKLFATAVVMIWNFFTRKKFLDAGDREERGESEEHADREECEEAGSAGREEREEREEQPTGARLP